MGIPIPQFQFDGPSHPNISLLYSSKNLTLIIFINATKQNLAAELRRLHKSEQILRQDKMSLMNNSLELELKPCHFINYVKQYHIHQIHTARYTETCQL